MPLMTTGRYTQFMASSNNHNELDSQCPPDPVIEAYKKDVDRTLLRENLKLTPQERVAKVQRFMHDLVAIRGQHDGTADPARATYDLGVCYARDAANLERIVGALAPTVKSVRSVAERAANPRFSARAAS